MFEGLLADVLDSLAGSFIQGLDRQNLNVGIWSGDVVLNELQVCTPSFAPLPPLVTFLRKNLLRYRFALFTFLESRSSHSSTRRHA
jgi:hypothetical protein